jgi:hypothetical protein
MLMMTMAVQISRTMIAWAPGPGIRDDTIAVPRTPNAIDPSAVIVNATLRWAFDGEGGCAPGAGTGYPGGTGPWYP